MKKYSNKAVIDSLNLPTMTDFGELIQHLRLDGKLVYWLASNANEKYKVHYIKKSNGGLREISSPVQSLKIVQRWILDNILSKIKVSPYSYGFQKSNCGSPLLCCAEKHRRNLYIMKIDIKDFYPSIKREKVFFTFTDIGYNAVIANILANLCTHKDSLPQGAVTSAYLANLICRNLDYRIAGLCNRRDIVYTRYADDLVFSSDNRDSLKRIYGFVQSIVSSEGFVINDNKTQFLSPGTRKQVLGITVNDNLIKAPKDMKRMVRAMIYKTIVSGDYSAYSVIKGYISYIGSIEKDYVSKVKKYILNFYDPKTHLDVSLIEAYNRNKFFSDMPDMIYVVNS